MMLSVVIPAPEPESTRQYGGQAWMPDQVRHDKQLKKVIIYLIDTMNEESNQKNDEILSPEQARQWLNDFLQEQQKEENK